MKAKEKSWVRWLAPFVVAVVLVVGLVLGVTLRKDEDVDLVVTAEDVFVEKGETKPLQYNMSIKKASVRFRVANKDIAEVEQESVFGKAVGETELVITARYNNLVQEKRVLVTVTDNVITPPQEQTPPESKDDDKKTEESFTPPVVSELELEILPIMGCKVNEKTIEIKPNKLVMLQVTTKEEFSLLEVISNSAELSASKAPDSPGTILLKATEPGEFQITLKANGKKTVFKVVAE